MKPITTDTLTKYLCAPGEILILDLGAASLQLVQSAVAKHVTNVTTKGGLSLPAEIWDMVFDFGAAAPRSSNLELVKITTHPPATVTDQVILFEAVKLTQIKPYEDFNEYRDLWSAMVFLACDEDEKPTIEKSDAFTLQWDADRQLPTRVVNIPFRHDGRASASRFQHLYHAISLAEVIAKVQDGQCGKCSNTRFICSCWGQSAPDRKCKCRGPLFDYDGKGMDYCMAVPCPVCLSLDLLMIWMTALSWDFKQKRGPHPADLSRILGERLEDLQYPTSLGKTAEQIVAEHGKALQDYAMWRKMKLRITHS
ncbi:hypothetical protein CONLIGDRAFT_717922 [Coniochaeta ligniaria NRRL 30616]|uniref:Uncharacterized protein n=1 Tax=Coniochaeta ligniaria NRRL 30616 TaxID=1408157 RepID=A0A1J7J547_9PEZI|nr:hypothetical protein CONLIGDRAFT_717922 [Coniochaeta ligniaria NRRL 30616]